MSRTASRFVLTAGWVDPVLKKWTHSREVLNADMAAGTVRSGHGKKSAKLKR